MHKKSAKTTDDIQNTRIVFDPMLLEKVQKLSLEGFAQSDIRDKIQASPR